MIDQLIELIDKAWLKLTFVLVMLFLVTMSCSGRSDTPQKISREYVAGFVKDTCLHSGAYCKVTSPIGSFCYYSGFSRAVHIECKYYEEVVQLYKEAEEKGYE